MPNPILLVGLHSLAVSRTILEHLVALLILACGSLLMVGCTGSGWSKDAEELCAPEAFHDQRARMVEEQLRTRGITSQSVLEAMRKVPRHCFVPSAFRDEAYGDHPLPIGLGQTISQPYIVGLMTELLQLKPDDTVLEIGTGSGYQAAVLSLLVKKVYSIEILPQLASQASRRLDTLGYKNVTVKTGDGNEGWSEHAPYNAIIVTAAAPRIPPALIEQLARGGRMCIPVGKGAFVQQLTVLTKGLDGSISERPVIPVAFVPLKEAHDIKKERNIQDPEKHQ